MKNKVIRNFLAGAVSISIIAGTAQPGFIFAEMISDDITVEDTLDEIPAVPDPVPADTFSPVPEEGSSFIEDQSETTQSEDPAAEETPPASEPTITDVPADDPIITDIPTSEPTITGVPADDPIITDIPTSEPTITDIPDDDPAVTDIPISEPTITDIPDDDSAVTDIPASEPTITGVPADGPVITDIPSSEPTITGVPDDDPAITDVPVDDPMITDIPAPTEIPSDEILPSPEPTPSVPESTDSDTSLDDDSTASPVPGETPAPLTIVPSPPITQEELAVLPEHIQELILRIKALSELEEFTIENQQEIDEIRQLYDALSDEEKTFILNYETFQSIEAIFHELLRALEEEESDELEADDPEEVTADVQIGTPIYYTNLVSNLHAGKEFYLNSLSGYYQLAFSEDFSNVMEEIESEYRAEYRLYNYSDLAGSLTTTSADVFLVRNWQDILAVYVYRHHLLGEESFSLTRDSKQELSEIFALMNPVIRDKSDITFAYYANYDIRDYIQMMQIPEDGQLFLSRYLETDCKLLCAVVTGAKGFVRQSVGDGVSEERINVITAAYSLIGRVGYFYGGKSQTIGEDPSWGSAREVISEGSTSTGTIRAYGLDCSGFVTWSVINGYQDTSMQYAIGQGTSEQWMNANMISESEAQPGDLVFEDGPEAFGPDNHVGILCGKTEGGDWIAVHCSSGKNGVTVGEAYGASFRYIRQPDFYPSVSELESIQPVIPDASVENPALGAADFDTAFPEGMDMLQDHSSVESFGEPILQDNSIVEAFDEPLLQDLSIVEAFGEPVGQSPAVPQWLAQPILQDDSTVEAFDELILLSDYWKEPEEYIHEETEILTAGTGSDLIWLENLIPDAENVEFLIDNSVVEPF